MTAELSLCGPRSRFTTTAIADARFDPTGTSGVRRRMKAEADRRWQIFGRTLRQAMIEFDLVGLRGIARLPHGDKTEGLAAWLEAELQQKVFATGAWMRPYIRHCAGAGGEARYCYSNNGRSGARDRDGESRGDRAARHRCRCTATPHADRDAFDAGQPLADQDGQRAGGHHPIDAQPPQGLANSRTRNKTPVP